MVDPAINKPINGACFSMKCKGELLLLSISNDCNPPVCFFNHHRARVKTNYVQWSWAIIVLPPNRPNPAAFATHLTKFTFKNSIKNTRVKASSSEISIVDLNDLEDGIPSWWGSVVDFVLVCCDLSRNAQLPGT